MRAALLLPTVLGLFAAPAALALDCSESAERELARLGIAGDEIGEVRYVEKINPTERGPDVLGVRAWIRLQACDSGHLVIDMRSEEHTSELQSLMRISYAVFCLKKKKHNKRCSPYKQYSSSANHNYL